MMSQKNVCIGCCCVCVSHLIVIYPADNAIHRLNNNWCQIFNLVQPLEKLLEKVHHPRLVASKFYENYMKGGLLHG